jgi:KAP family P-loop domain
MVPGDLRRFGTSSNCIPALIVLLYEQCQRATGGGALDRRKPIIVDVPGVGPEETLARLRDNPKHLIEWLKREEPIIHPGQDMFGVKVAARRFAARLQDVPATTSGIVGPRGMGKTSFLKLVEHYLQESKTSTSDAKPKHIWTCTVDGWGLQSGPAAAEYVLNRVLDALSKHVDCVALAGLPSDYRAALANAGPTWARVTSALFSRHLSPTSQLLRLQPILDAVDGRIVIFIEDLDRNPNDDNFFRQIEAMLDRLRHLSRVTFVLAISEMASGKKHTPLIDFTRLCNRTESYSRLDPWSVWEVVVAFRQHCLSHFSGNAKGDVDPALPEIRRTLSVLDKMQWEMGGGNQPWTYLPRQIASLLSTPRSLKRALRRTWQAWEALHGELDFDDLLVCNVLREAQPRLYDGVLLNIHRIRGLTPVVDELDQRSVDQVDQEKDGILSAIGGLGTAEGEAGRCLVFFLFPILGGQYVPRRQPSPPQSVAMLGTDYWERANARGPRDQEVLRTMRESKLPDGSGRRELLCKLMVDQPFADRVEYFARNVLPVDLDMSGSEIRSLASDLFREILDRFGAASHTGSVVGYAALWRALMRKGGMDAQWSKREVVGALERSLSFTNDLLSFWASKTYHFVNNEGHAEVYAAMISRAESLFADDPARLISVLDSSIPNTLARFGSPSEVNRADLANLEWFGPAILSAAALNPARMGLQICYLLLEGSMAPMGEIEARRKERPMVYSVSKAGLDKFFPGFKQRKQVLEILAANPMLEASAPRECPDIMVSVSNDARARLATMGSNDGT